MKRKFLLSAAGKRQGGQALSARRNTMQTFIKNLAAKIPLATLLVGSLAACQTTTQPDSSAIALEEAATLAKGCQPVKDRRGLIAITATAKGTGRQCLVQDLVQRNVRDLIDGRNRGSPEYNGVIAFYDADDLDLDLQGHLVSGKPFDNTAGIVTNGGRSKLRAHNGKVQTPGGLSMGVYMGYIHVGTVDKAWQPGGGPAEREDNEPVMSTGHFAGRPGEHQYQRMTYDGPPTRYTIDNLQIESGGRGVIMAGSDNVLRNNVIEVDSKVAVYMYGPRPVIEGNTFIVHLDPRDTTTLPAILKLRDADGAIVRNNRFLVKAGLMTGLVPGKAEAAINLLTSKDVLIENNTIEDTRRLVRKDEVSTTVERGNTLK